MTRRLLALFLLAALAPAQEGPRSPQELWRTFFEETGKYVEKGDKEALARAGRLFDLSDLSADRDVVGQRAAKDLLNYVSRLDEQVTYDFFPDESGKQGFHSHPTPHGSLISLRTEDGTWRFSQETRKQAYDFYQRVVNRAARVVISDSTGWIRDHLPGWLLHRTFLLENWQWLGLLVLVFLGILGGAIFRYLFMRVGQRVAGRSGVKLKQQRRTGRPFSLLAAAAIWMFGLRLLGLPENPYRALMFVTRILLMLSVVWSVMRLVDWIAEVLAGVARRTDNRLDDLIVPMVRKALKVFTIALGIVWIADNVGMDVAALVAGLGIGGIAIALASKDTVENLFGAAAILTDRPFQVGDWIRMGDIEGTVEEVGFRSTRVRTFYNSIISFPNAMLIRSEVDNLGARRYRRIKETVGVTYDTPADKLEAFVEAIRELIRRHPYTRKDYFHVYFHTFGSSSLDILLYLFLECPDWATELRERQRLMLDILRLGHELGVEFAFPTQRVHVVRDSLPDHGEPRGIQGAHRAGRRAAKGIVEEFTGPEKPPPVVIGDSPDDAAGGGD